MKNQMTFAKLGLMVGAVSLLATGCASSDVARYDNNLGGEAEATSALSFVPQTHSKRVSAWPHAWNIRAMETYTFVVPADGVQVTANTPSFDEDLPEGSVFVEAAGGTSEPYRVVRHSPNPR